MQIFAFKNRHSNSRYILFFTLLLSASEGKIKPSSFIVQRPLVRAVSMGLNQPDAGEDLVQVADSENIPWSFNYNYLEKSILWDTFSQKFSGPSLDLMLNDILTYSYVI